MMKNGYELIILIFLIVSCQSKSDLDPIDETRIESEIDKITDVLHQTFFEFEVEGGDQNRAYEDKNEGLHGIYGVSRTDANSLEGNKGNLFNCFQSIGLSLPQLNQIRGATNNFSACRNRVTRNYRGDFSSLLQNMEAQRKQLIANHQGNTSSLLTQLNELRNRFRAELLELKESYGDELRTCLRTYIENIRNRLDDGQWDAFVDCVLD
ncbi:hypothetical protein [Mongoliibacter sp.]|uniref:hypothetical protein n=1 Tax=Mongoliibacter sp. TaxID=2022438 RepID=UPI0025D5CBB4|nr:hypothetical protein [Mongoliibacter sp.]